MTRAQRYTLLVLLIAAARQAVCQVTAPAPAPVGIVAVTRCTTCPTAAPTDARTLYLSILVETDVAQFYSYTSEGAILVYFVARATFSVAPTQLRLSNFIIENGSVLEVVAENPCTQFLLKGAVQQQVAWTTNYTEINVSVPNDAITDCQGVPFPGASATTLSRDGPIGSMYVPDMGYTAAGPITQAALNTIQLAFSEPVSALDITQFTVTLTAAPDTVAAAPPSNSRRLSQASLAAAPALLPDCLPAYQIQAVPAVQNSTQFYNIFLTLPECFYGAVMVYFTGQVTNAAGLISMPIKPVGFNRVATNIPVPLTSAYENMPPLGQSLNDTCT